MSSTGFPKTGEQKERNKDPQGAGWEKTYITQLGTKEVHTHAAGYMCGLGNMWAESPLEMCGLPYAKVC